MPEGRGLRRRETMQELIPALATALDLYRKIQDRLTLLRVYNIKPEHDYHYQNLEQDYQKALDRLSTMLAVKDETKDA